jgi:RimJ/RimL family protein N-acetyltransferase
MRSVSREDLATAKVPGPACEDSGMASVLLREVVKSDLPVFFEHQREPEANRMAAFPARDREAFDAHWKNKVLGAPGVVVRTIVGDGEVAGNVVSWESEDERLVGYWIGREFWGQGIATEALRQFVAEVAIRPLRAHVATTNPGSIRVLEKCGFSVASDPVFVNDTVTEMVLELSE